MDDEKELRWLGTTYQDLLGFPLTARRDAGYQLSHVQAGLEPRDWKSFSSIGPGTQEIRLHTVDGAFRVIYVARFAEAIYVLHCFQKKTQATGNNDIAIAKARYQQVAAWHRSPT